ncbi:MAG: hypothetical protein LC624_00155 [Halobacteriales archaeon]|nr:hypothetical protein [Halobacteriales archaeon]
MRRSLLVPAVLIALLAQPMLSPLAHGDDDPAAFDPLRVTPTLYLAPQGALGEQPPADGTVGAPEGVPGQPGIAVWARDMPAGQLRGVATLTLKAELDMPALAPPTARGLFNVTLRRGAEAVASGEAGPALATPGPMTLEFQLAVDDAPFQQGDGLSLEVAFLWLSAGAMPSVRYDVGAGGSTLQLREELRSLDQLGHQHAAGERHALLNAYQFRTGDLGQGLWGTDLALGTTWDGSPLRPGVPASAQRILVQMHITPDLPNPPASLAIDAFGAQTTVYRGEVVVREVPRPVAGTTISCGSCGADARPSSIVFADASPGSASPGGSGEPLTQDAFRATAASSADDDQLYVLVLALPALLMLGGVMLYAVRQELRADAHHAPPRGGRASSRAQVRAPSRSIKPPQPLRPVTRPR